MILALLLVGSLSAEERRRFESAVALHLASDLAAAEREYRAIVESNPDFVPARLYRSEALWLLDSRDAARGELDSVRAVCGELLLFRVLERTFGGFKAASDTVAARLLESYPLERHRFLATGTPSLLLLSMGDVDEAITDYERAASLDSEDATLHRRLGAAFAKSKLWVPGITAFSRVVRLDPKDAAAWRQLGSGNLVLQRWSPAIAAFEKALELSGDEPGVLLALGYAYERTPDVPEALDRYRRAAVLAPGWAQPPYRIGRALLALGKLDDARKALEASHALEPDLPQPLTFLGEIHLKRGEMALAVDNLERAVESNPEFYEAYYRLAQAYRRLGRDEDARQAIARYDELKNRLRDVSSQEEILARAGERKREP